MGEEDLGEALGGDFTAPDVDQSTDKRANHITKKAVGRDSKREGVVGLLPGGFGYVANVGVVGRVKLGERCEVVVSEEACSGFVHFVDIEGCAEEPGSGGAKRVFGRSDEVGVCARSGVEASVSGRGNGKDAVESNVERKKRVGVVKKVGRQGGREYRRIGGVEVGDVKRSVDAGVGTTSAGYFDGEAEEGGKNLLDSLLDGRSVRLALPTVKMGTEVGKFEKEAHRK